METPITDNKGKLILIPNPNLYNNWLENLKNTPFIFGTGGEVDTCNGKDFNLLFESNIKLTDSEIAIDSAFKKLQEIKEKITHKAYPLTPDKCLKKENWLNTKKQILVITLPSYFLNVIKVLKTNKEQYFILYRDKYNIRGKRFDAIVVDSSMPFHLEFYNDIMKYIRYDVPSYLLENETLKILK